MKNKSAIYLLLIFAIFVFHAINNCIVLKQDNVPLYYDEGGYHNLSLSYYKYLFSSPSLSKFLHHFHSISQFYPPFVFIERIPFYMILGVSEDVSVLANLPFLLILICFTFLIGKHIADRKTGLLAAFLISFYPGIYGFSRTNFVTIPLAAIIAMSFYFLLRSTCFTIRKYSVLFGFSAGTGLLTKWLYIIYIFPAIMVYIFQFFKKNNYKKSNSVMSNFFIALATTILLSIFWYLPNIKTILPMIFNANYDNPNWSNYVVFLKNNPFKINLLNYLLVMEEYLLYTFYTILFICFLYRYFMNKKNDFKLFFITSLGVPYIIFTFAAREYYTNALGPRYIVPLFILIAVITAKGALEIKQNILRKIIIILIVLVGFTQFYFESINYDSKCIYTQKNFRNRTTRGLLAPKMVDWKIDEIIGTIRVNRISNKPRVLIIPHTPLTSALAYRLELKNDCSVIFLLNTTFVGVNYSVLMQEEYKKLIDSADFILTQDGGMLIYDDSEWVRKNVQAALGEFKERSGDFVLLNHFNVDMDDEKTKLIIYKRIKPQANTMIQLEPEGEGILMQSVDFINGNLAYSEKFGLLIDGGELPAYAKYEIDLSENGDYELWVKYATMANRPVDIYFDGVLKTHDALTTFTEGWTYSDARWFKEAYIKDVKKGRHSLKFVAAKTPFVHIGAIKLIKKMSD